MLEFRNEFRANILLAQPSRARTALSTGELVTAASSKRDLMRTLSTVKTLLPLPTSGFGDHITADADVLVREDLTETRILEQVSSQHQKTDGLNSPDDEDDLDGEVREEKTAFVAQIDGLKTLKKNPIRDRTTEERFALISKSERDLIAAIGASETLVDRMFRLSNTLLALLEFDGPVHIFGGLIIVKNIFINTLHAQTTLVSGEKIFKTLFKRVQSFDGANRHRQRVPYLRHLVDWGESTKDRRGRGKEEIERRVALS